MQSRPVGGGAELLTVFTTPPGRTEEIPLVSLLRDTLGDDDPENDRLRDVWVLTSADPTLMERVAAAIPFFYFTPSMGTRGGKKPSPVLDLGDTERSAWSAIAAQLTQVLAVDGTGTMIRASSRRYRANVADQRQVRLIEGLTVISQLEEVPEIETILSEPELLEIQARLALAGQTLGGLVTAQKLPEAYFKQRRETDERRGHNWELLRQAAERNGLFFESFGVAGSATHALVWVDRAEASAAHRFDARFLSIDDPYGDRRVIDWPGVVAQREGRELVPLALYALDYPKVPLLLVDFRDTSSPKRREMLTRATVDTLTGVLGVTRWGNWPYMAGSWGFDFVRSRWGKTNDPVERLRAASLVRRWLALDRSIDPELRVELQRRLEAAGVNPLDDNVFDEAEIALRQYDALLNYADDPKGLPAQLERDRHAELSTYEHKTLARIGLKAASWATLGIYRHREADDAEALHAAIDHQRKEDRQVRFLEAVLRSSPRPEVVWNMDAVRRTVEELSAAKSASPRVTNVLREFAAFRAGP